jgi:ribosomal protein S18 acetylase RimI-like enzyme
MSVSIAPSLDVVSLDNPIWNSLVTEHAALAEGADVGRGLARRYPSEIGPLAAFERQTPEAYADLAALISIDDFAVLFLDEPLKLPEGWRLLRGGEILQMMSQEMPDKIDVGEEIVSLGEGDWEEMIALATLTEPGPFRARTADLGGFMGIRVGGKLAAITGRRLQPAGFVEVSAVCTHPEFRGRGYAKALVAAVTRAIYADGKTPFLATFANNTSAIRVYEQVGYVARRILHLAVVKPPTIE